MPKFHERFAIEVGVEEGKRRFVNRVLNFLIETAKEHAGVLEGATGGIDLERYLCSKLGERYTGFDCLKQVMGTDFDKCLQALEALYKYPRWTSFTNMAVKSIIDDTEVDIGIRWDMDNGHFLPAGAPVLDDALVNDPLNLLKTAEYKGVSEAFSKGLDHFLHSTKNLSLLTNVLTDMHEALEAIAKLVCQNEKELSANREAFISSLGLADPYKRMLKEYIDYANKFGRHAGPQGMPKPVPSRKEVEAFIYLTGLFIRLAVSKNS